MKFYCGNRMMEIIATGNGIDRTGDLLNVGNLNYNEELDAYEVDDLDETVEYAEDWQNCEGDFAGNDHDGTLEVFEVDFPPKTKDGHYISAGDWLQDCTGVYVVQNVSNRVELKEVVFEDDDKFQLGDRRILTIREVEQMTTF